MDDQGVFRCYYDDGTILEAQYCPDPNPQGSPLVNAEYTIIENVEDRTPFPWWLLLIALLLLSEERKGQR